MARTRKNPTQPAKVKTYGAGQGRRVAVPEEAFQDPKPEDLLMDAIRDSFSPEAVAAITIHLQAAKTNNAQVNEQITWLTNRLIAMLGRVQYARLLGEIGL